MNIFDITGIKSFNDEVFENIIEGKNLKIERIISRGQTTPAGEWYDQKLDEWVVLLQGDASIEYSGGESVSLHRGDSLFLPAGKKHRVSFTSSEPACIWLAVHGDLS